ncbi:hypothetical protein K443DRAFT_89994, partial [Laccaria amethystina LaAM-08-1]
LKIKAGNVLCPGQAVIADNTYEMTFSIAHHVTNPLPLSCVADYQHLVENVLCQQQPMVKVIIKATAHPQGAPDKENVPPALDRLDALVDWVLGPAPNVNDILPGNIAKNDNIKQLHLHWECTMSNCSSEHCYIPADGPHFALSHDHFDKWAVAMVRCYN